MTLRPFALCAAMTFAFAAAPVHAEVKPSPLFSDHMVLLSGAEVPVWGTAAPGEKVTVKLLGQTRSATASPDGRWTIRLAKLKAGGPFEMTIAGDKTPAPITVHDVLVGEVWLGSGQSNMVFNVSNVGHRPYGLQDEAAEIAAANFPQVRMFTVKDTKSLTPVADPDGEWKVCSPATVADFSAIGYLFARDLNQQLKVPVGILLAAYGASTAEAWVPRDALAADPQLKPILDGFDTREAAFKSAPPPPPPSATPPPPPTPGAVPAPRRARGGGDPVQDQHQPTVLFNGMLNPLIPYAIRGAIWYQGESILGNPGIPMYPHIMETLVTAWRKRWAEGNFPFYAVQLAALKNNSNNPRVREAQAEILSLPNTGLAITIDIGDPGNVHPKNKEPLADRLTRIALANVYGRKIEFSGPMYTAMKVEGPAIRLTFTHAEGLTTHYPVDLYAHVSGTPAPPHPALPQHRCRFLPTMRRSSGSRSPVPTTASLTPPPPSPAAPSSSPALSPQSRLRPLRLGQLSVRRQPLQRRRPPRRALPHRQERPASPHPTPATRQLGHRRVHRELPSASSISLCALCGSLSHRYAVHPPCAIPQNPDSFFHHLKAPGEPMPQVRLLVGTRKGAFILTSDEARKEWDVFGPHFPGWELYHLKASPANPNRIYASQSSGWFGQIVQRSDDGGLTWTPVGNKFAYDGVPGTHQWYDGTPPPLGLQARLAPRTLPHQSRSRLRGSRRRWPLPLHRRRPHVVRALRPPPPTPPGPRGSPEPEACASTQSSSIPPIPSASPSPSPPPVPSAPTTPASTGSPSTKASVPPTSPTRSPRSATASTILQPTPPAPPPSSCRSTGTSCARDNSGDHWHEISGNLPTDFGFCIDVHAHEPETLYVVPIKSDSEHFVPDGKLRVFRSRSGGNDWEPLTRGLPQQDCYVNILRDAMAVDTLDSCGIYFGTSGGQVYASSDSGDTWNAIVRDLPPVLSVEVQTLA